MPSSTATKKNKKKVPTLTKEQLRLFFSSSKPQALHNADTSAIVSPIKQGQVGSDKNDDHVDQDELADAVISDLEPKDPSQ